MKKTRLVALSFLVIAILFSLIACQRQGTEEEASKGGENSLARDNSAELSLSPEVKEAIKKMEKEEIGPDYVKTEEDFFDETTLHIFYERKLEGGGTDAYDAYDVFFDIENLKAEEITKKGESHQLEEGKGAISEEEARKIANDFLGAYNRGPVDQVKITTAKEDLRFIELLKGNYNPSYEEPGDLRQVYLFSNEELEIAIDQYTGEVVTGGLFEGIKE